MRKEYVPGANGYHQGPALLADFEHSREASKSGLEWAIYRGDTRKILPRFPEEYFDCVVTSPPYFWQRDYEEPEQIGLERSIDEYVTAMANVMDEVRRVLTRTGLLFLNLGDTYYSRKGQPKGSDRKNWARRFGVRAVDVKGLDVPRKTAIGIPWRVAIEMIGRKWILRSPIVWRREGSQPEPTAKDRPWRTYETVFMFSKNPVYHFKREALGDDEDVWTIPAHSRNTKKSQTAFFPEELVTRCLNVGCKAGGCVLDPFAGTGTVLRAALRSNRTAVGIDLSQRLCDVMADGLRKL